MIQLGCFQRAEDGYVGALKTLTLDAEVRISPAARTNDKAPDHRVFIGDLECGAAWSLTDDKGGGVLNVKLDDPTLPEPIYARLMSGSGADFLLVWSRRTD
ncbi:DUF736 domain-containing protein [Phenylobacterium sp.]|uniref:DUF736 domain-containing protein n=1 Tax=Phenylobacterium sp. TaxID=1871053 RepID=UPI002FCC319E